MTTSTSIQKDIRDRLTAEVEGVAVYDRWAQGGDATPYITFGPTQVVRNHSKEARFRIYFVTLHLFYRDQTGSIASRNLADEIVDALDMQKLTDSQLDCYFTDLISVYEDDEVTNHIVLNFEVR